MCSYRPDGAGALFAPHRACLRKRDDTMMLTSLRAWLLTSGSVARRPGPRAIYRDSVIFLVFALVPLCPPLPPEVYLLSLLRA